MESYSLWDENLEELVMKAANTPVKEIMYTPSGGEYVKVTASLGEAVHKFLLGSHQSLLVLDGKTVVGVIRLSDIFDLIYHIIE